MAEIGIHNAIQYNVDQYGGETNFGISIVGKFRIEGASLSEENYFKIFHKNYFALHVTKNQVSI